MPSLLLSAAAAVAAAAATMPCVTLKNAAAPGTCMPAIGVGTGGYTATNPFYGSWPENWNECISDPTCTAADPPGAPGVSYCQAAISTWLTLGGRRVDTSTSYRNQKGVGQAINASRRVNRSDVFVTSKVGPYLAMGYAEAKEQVGTMLAAGGLGTYVDLVLIHWPSCAQGGGCDANTTTPACMSGQPSYNATACRLATWAGLVELQAAGAIRAIGVSNFGIAELQEFIDAGVPLPSVNQLHHNIYGRADPAVVAFCTANGVHVQSYSPLGVPDHKTFAAPCAPTPLEDPVVLAAAAAHGMTPAQVLLAHQWGAGVSSNPRTMDALHMIEDLSAAGMAGLLTPAEIAQLDARPQC